MLISLGLWECSHIGRCSIACMVVRQDVCQLSKGYTGGFVGTDLLKVVSSAAFQSLGWINGSFYLLFMT